MLQTEYLLAHIDALLRLSHDVKDRTVAAKLREMADEFRIMVSVADISDMAATLNKNTLPPTADSVGRDAVSRSTLEVAREDTAGQPLRLFQARYSEFNRTSACSRVGAP